MKIISCLADLRRDPSPDAALDTQLLYGEEVQIDAAKTKKADSDWAYATTAKDGYRGWVQQHKMADNTCVPSHRLNVIRSLVYVEANIKSPPLGMLHLNSQMRLKPAVQGEDTRFRQIIDQSDLKRGFIIADHVAKLDDKADLSPVDIARKFLHTPYYWGGRSSFGLDCSALVQLAFEACGVQLPRDSGDQEKYAAEHGRKIEADQRIEAGDLVFWKGHVAMMLDGKEMIHTNGTDMMVSTHQLEGFKGRVATETGDVTGVYRLNKP